jgi:hypothetical protein
MEERMPRKTACDRRLRQVEADLKKAKKALRVAAAALEGPPDIQDPHDAFVLVKRTVRELGR